MVKLTPKFILQDHERCVADMRSAAQHAASLCVYMYNTFIIFLFTYCDVLFYIFIFMFIFIKNMRPFTFDFSSKFRVRRAQRRGGGGESCPASSANADLEYIHRTQGQ